MIAPDRLQADGFHRLSMGMHFFLIPARREVIEWVDAEVLRTVRTSQGATAHALMPRPQAAHDAIITEFDREGSQYD